MIRITAAVLYFINFELAFAQWAPQNSTTTADLNSICFVGDQLGWIGCNDGTILRTTNGGVSWESHLLTTGGVSDVQFITAQDGFATAGHSIFKSGDGGATWSICFTDTTLSLGVVRYLNSETAIVGLSHNTLRTSNAGLSWDKVGVDTFYYAIIRDAFFKNATTGWLAADDGTLGSIYKTTDAGQSWQIQLRGSSSFTRVIGFTNSDTLYCIGVFVLHGASRTLYRSVDGGESWSQIIVPAGPSVLSFLSGTRGWVAGYIGLSIYNTVILRTDDAGISWVSEDSTNNPFLAGMVCKPSGQVWAVGDGGLILHRDASLFVQGTLGATENWQLMNNYPNPFNPSTAIAFSLARECFVTLRIYNILGQQISTVFSGKLGPGKHVTIWDASGKPSGIYFYKLETSGFDGIRKMLLIR